MTATAEVPELGLWPLTTKCSYKATLNTRFFQHKSFCRGEKEIFGRARASPVLHGAKGGAILCKYFQIPIVWDLSSVDLVKQCVPFKQCLSS